VALAADEAAKHPDPEQRQAADDLVALMTPIVKASFTDMGFDCASTAVQVWGGQGYIRENGMDQLMRDARITQIYEGTNGIQALDLIGRKLGQGTGRRCAASSIPSRPHREAAAEPALAGICPAAGQGLRPLQQLTAQIAQAGLRDPRRRGGGHDYLSFFALVARPIVGPHGPCRLAQQEGAEAGLLQGEARHRAIFHGAGPAAAGRALPDDRQRQAEPHGAAGRGVLRFTRADGALIPRSLTSSSSWSAGRPSTLPLARHGEA
jgi:hypothetical protein